MKVEEFVSDTIETSQLDQSLKQVLPASFYLSNQIEPITLGTFQTHFGASILLPFYFQYDNIDQVDDSYVCQVLRLNYSLLSQDETDDGKPVLEHLRQCLIMSADAKRFAFTSLIHNNSMPAGFYAEIFGLFVLPFLANESANLMQRRLRLKNPLINVMASILGYFSYYMINPLLKQTQTRYGHLCVYKYEPSDVQKGSKEYFDKLKQLQWIIDKYGDDHQSKSNSTKWLIHILRSSTYYSFDQQQQDCCHFEKNLQWSNLFFYT
ncbi:hypothetical protein HUG17_0617 [Dermatophagoides farinae]|nr:hypothetical protein HUG17_0617 [Dermatophagoides farinae]